jgi:hypothetical protein
MNIPDISSNISSLKGSAKYIFDCLQKGSKAAG